MNLLKMLTLCIVLFLLVLSTKAYAITCGGDSAVTFGSETKFSFTTTGYAGRSSARANAWYQLAKQLGQECDFCPDKSRQCSLALPTDSEYGAMGITIDYKAKDRPVSAIIGINSWYGVVTFRIPAGTTLVFRCHQDCPE